CCARQYEARGRINPNLQASLRRNERPQLARADRALAEVRFAPERCGAYQENPIPMKSRILDHIDLRVKDFQRANEFYGKLLPALGFSCDRSDETWGTFYSV